ncbi:phage antirepressor YoqD-like protein [Paenibacillus anaericanus]|uniref:phage antirepressor KilAC domain-containing protein n=1 Tax=Paenibacillus anaericanus TaxID=170367 RepID=UPI0027822195|nr:phage antirepressor KilAC domain-containing protein [Paenibacillus anaericanus]MDQ0091620.1 phage antirepressor YoqD-like protein [Paenibacillus anaericanus]
MTQLITIHGVKGFIDGNGTAQLNLEDVSRGLGFTDNSKGPEYIRWNTVKSYLIGFGFSQEVAKETFIPENIFFRLAMKARNEIAEAFQAKVADEILPSIRKHGAYLTPAKLEEVLLNPDTIIQLATQIKTEQEANRLLKSQIDRDKPKVIFAEALETSNNSILIGELAKLLKQNGIKVGQNRLFVTLRQEGYLGRKGDYYNLPTQRSMELGLFEIKTRTIVNPDESIRTTKTTKVTGKGQIYFINRFKDQSKLA